MSRRQRKSESFGKKGRNLVRVRERSEPDRRGQFELVWSAVDPSTGRRKRFKRACGHDRDAAEQQAENLSEHLRRTPEAPLRSTKRTLRTLIRHYLAETNHKRKHAYVSKHLAVRLEMFAKCVGPDRDPAALDQCDFDKFTRERRTGVIYPGKKPRKAAVNSQTVQNDLRGIMAMLNWGTRVKVRVNETLLAANPFQGYKLGSQDAMRRHLCVETEYGRMCVAARTIHPICELGLRLAWETGRRSSAVRLLWWSDFTIVDEKDTETGETVEQGYIRWRPENDKKKRNDLTPISHVARDALLAHRAQFPGVGDTHIFTLDPSTGRPVSRDTFVTWWQVCEDRAGIPHRPHAGWHSLRRAFVNRYRHAPVKDVAALAGMSVSVLLRIYAQSDARSMRNVLRLPRPESSIPTPPGTPLAFIAAG